MAARNGTRPRVRLLCGERRSGESVRAVLACNRFLRLGPGRTLALLHRQFLDEQEATGILAPSRSDKTLSKWHVRWGWGARSEQYDEIEEAERQVKYERIREQGLARLDERLLSLMKTAEMLEAELHDESKRWIEKAQTILYGDRAEGKWTREFNFNLAKEYRGALGDIAAELGARKQAAVQIDSMQLTLKGYAMTDTSGRIFRGPDAWDELEAGKDKEVDS